MSVVFRICVGLLLTVLASACQAEILPPSQAVNGLSQAELSARYWQWGLSYADGANPIQDLTGAFSFLGGDQTPVAHPSVFFLPGTFGDPTATRSVTVTAADFLYVPLTTAVSIIPFFGSDEATIRADALATLGNVSGLFARLDGVDLPLPPATNSLNDFLQLSPPGTFPVTFPNNAVFGLPAGTFEAVSVSYPVILSPLAPGNYTLEFGAITSGTPGVSDPTNTSFAYQITVVPEPASVFVVGAATLCFVSRRRTAHARIPKT